MVESRQTSGIGPFEAYQAGNRCLRRHPCKDPNLFRAPAESGSLQQVRRKVGIPIRGADGGQIVFPGDGHVPLLPTLPVILSPNAEIEKADPKTVSATHCNGETLGRNTGTTNDIRYYR
jgi:hypothetical protein